MGEEGFSKLSPIISENKTESFYSMLFGISCAVFALKKLRDPEILDTKWSQYSDILLQGSAHIMGLLMWRVQKTETKREKRDNFCKLKNMEREIEELKRRRKEDAKANEKVVGIYNSQEQIWFLERKKMRQQIGALLNELRVVQKKNDEIVSEMEDKLEERREMEEKVLESEKALEEMRESKKREIQEHCSEIWKHKTAFIELVSNQRQIEAEMGRALKQAEASKEEVNLALEQREEAVSMAQKLSLELVKTRKDLDQKDKILSAMLRKLKMDSAEKQMLLKELKISKSKRKQAKLERAVSETRRERHSLKSILSKHTSFKFRSNIENVSHSRNRSVPSDFLLEYDQPQQINELQISSPVYKQYLHEENDESMFDADIKHLESWVRSEAEKYSNLVEQRHHEEVNAFSEQLRLKDENLEIFHWRLISMELDSKRLVTHVEELNHDILHLRQENMKLDNLLLEKEAEMNSLKHQFALKFESQNQEIENLNQVSETLASNRETIWSNVTIIKRNPAQIQEEEKTIIKPLEEKELSSTSQSKDIVLNVQSPENEIEGSIRDIVEIVENPSSGNFLSKNNILPWKMDIHALGVAYKIKRLKQQLVMLERFTGKQKSSEYSDDSVKGFHLLMQFLNKQVSRYQSLQEKIDELCTRMHENESDSSPGDFRVAKSKTETKTLSNYLDETFQIQRYIVASGQKLMELQSKIVYGFAEAAEGLDGQGSFDMKRCGDSVGTMFKEIQRGLEVRIAKIIGDVEGTLACDGIIHLRR